MTHFSGVHAGVAARICLRVGGNVGEVGVGPLDSQLEIDRELEKMGGKFGGGVGGL